MQGNLSSQCGVKGDCILRNALQYFHPTTGFPPDALHDLLEGIVPVELALCMDRMIRLKYFSLDSLNKKIESFPYKGTDATDKPKPIIKTFATKKSIGGNGHENNTLLRLFPLIIGDAVPEGDGAWIILMDLKEIVELVLCPIFDEESIQYLQSKILLFVSVGQEGGLPQFSKVENILIVNNNVSFLCNDHKSFYIEHLRSFELFPGNVAVHSITELNDSLPLCAYNVSGKLLLSPKRFVLPLRK